MLLVDTQQTSECGHSQCCACTPEGGREGGRGEGKGREEGGREGGREVGGRVGGRERGREGGRKEYSFQHIITFSFHCYSTRK